MTAIDELRNSWHAERFDQLAESYSLDALLDIYVPCRVLSTVEADNQIAAEVRFTGTHTGPLASPRGEIAPSGRRVILDYADVLRFAGEALQSEHVYFDQVAFLKQLGLSRPDETRSAAG